MYPASFKNIENREGFQIGSQMRLTFPPDFVFTSERPHYSLALFSSFICTCKFSKKIEFASKKTLDYFRKKYPEYANNWLVSQIAVRAETVNVTAHLVGCKSFCVVLRLSTLYF